MKIALDAMGGDRAPKEIIAGAVKAINTYNDFSLILLGNKEIITDELANYHYPETKIEIVSTTQIIKMDESPIIALKKKKDSSIVRGLKLVKENKANAFVSAGSTGAVMAGSLFNLGRLTGIKRPSIAINFPSVTGNTLVMDAGANTDCKPEHLLQFALMGQIYAENILKIDNPRLGLLSIGEEREKGNKLTSSTYELLEKDLRIRNFIGNVEGRDIFNGNCDLVICDGFVGNVVLKTTEGIAKFMFKLLKEAMTKDIRSKIGTLLIKPYLKELMAKTDYHQYGGAPLLGVNGVVIISHGSSDRIAIMNAIRVAREIVKKGVVNLISEEINEDIN